MKKFNVTVKWNEPRETVIKLSASNKITAMNTAYQQAIADNIISADTKGLKVVAKLDKTTDK